MAFPDNWKRWELEISKLIARAWMDEEFKQRFIHHPGEVIREAGLEVEDFVSVHVCMGPGAEFILRGTESGTVFFQIPLNPRPEGLEDSRILAFIQGENVSITGVTC